MKKIVLLLLVLALGWFGYARWQASQPADTSWNQTARLSLGKHPSLRWLLGLRRAGDARQQYLSGSGPIVVEIVAPENTPMSSPGVDAFVKALESSLGRHVTLYTVDNIASGTFGDAELEAADSSYHRHASFGEPGLFIMYTDDFTGSDVSPVRTFNEYGIVLSRARVEQLTASFPEDRPEYTTSLLLHGVGRQLGLPDSDVAGCVMHPDVEHPKGAVRFGGLSTPVEFCDRELEFIGTQKN